MDLGCGDSGMGRCFKFPHKVYGNLNIVYHETSSVTVLWNVYQIFVYDDLSFLIPNVLIPEFNVADVIICNNYIICLDDNGNIHITPLKLKQSTQKRLKTSFQPREKGIQCIRNFNENTVCVKYISNNFYLCTHRVCTDLILESKHKMVFDNLLVSPQYVQPWIFHIYSITCSEYDQIKGFYGLEETWKDHVILMISFDKINLYSILYSSKTGCESLLPIKLYSSPSELTGAYVVRTGNISVILTLAIGTLIKFPITNNKNDIEIVHLNTALHKLLYKEDFIMYSDGNAMWKSEETFTELTKFKKCLVAQVKDFVIIRGKILCTTFSNLIYLLCNDDELFKDLPKNEYCPANEVLSNNDCLESIMSEVTKSNDIVKKIKDEERYLTILSLSNRCDILDNFIHYGVSVFESFEDVPKEELTLLESIQSYYCKDAFCFLINISLKSLGNKLTELLSSTFGDLMININISSHTYCVKTISTNIKGQFKKVNLAVPILKKESNLCKFSVEIKLLTSVTAVFNKISSVWTVIHSKKFYLNSENFIKTKLPANQLYFAADEESLDPIYQSTVCHFEHLYKFNKNKRKNIEWSLYANLVENFQAAIKNSTYLDEIFSTQRANILVKQFSSEDFLKCNNEVSFEIGNDKITLEIINDGFSKPILKVRCTNIEKANDLRNFISQIVNNNFKEFGPGKEFVDHGLYSTVEKFQRSMQTSSMPPHSNMELMNMFEKYQKSVIGKLPI